MNFRIKQTRDILVTQSGLALVGTLLKRCDYHQKMDELPSPPNRGNNLTNSDIAVSMIGLLCQGKTDFADIDDHSNDPFFPLALQIHRVPSQERLRQRLDMADEAWDEVARQTGVQLLKNHALFTSCYEDFIPVDIDVSVMDNSGTRKEGVRPTYNHKVGYAPIFAHIGTEGYMLNTQFRSGDVHSQKNTPDFLRDTLSLLHSFSYSRYLFRMDGAFDSVENLRVIDAYNRDSSQRVDFIIKRNLRRMSLEGWLEMAKKEASLHEPRKGKQVYLGKVPQEIEGVSGPIYTVYKVTVREIDSSGQLLLVPEIEVEAYWTSLDIEAEKIIELYHQRGTSEQFHSELKSDIGLERFPSGYFATNQRILHLSMLAFNLLRIMGQESLNHDGTPNIDRHRVRRRRLRTVIQKLIYLAARLSYHARGFWLSFSQYCPYFHTFRYLYNRWAT